MPNRVSFKKNKQQSWKENYEVGQGIYGEPGKSLDSQRGVALSGIK